MPKGLRNQGPKDIRLCVPKHIVKHPRHPPAIALGGIESHGLSPASEEGEDAKDVLPSGVIRNRPVGENPLGSGVQKRLGRRVQRGYGEGR